MNLNETIEHFSKWQAKIMQMQADVQKELELYRAECKAKLGVADGEQCNILDMVKLMQNALKLG